MKEIEIYEYKEFELFGEEVEKRVSLSAATASRELLDKYEIEYYEIEECAFDFNTHVPSLKIKICRNIDISFKTTKAY